MENSEQYFRPIKAGSIVQYRTREGKVAKKRKFWQRQFLIQIRKFEIFSIKIFKKLIFF